jgi:hypothetical protein
MIHVCLMSTVTVEETVQLGMIPTHPVNIPCGGGGGGGAEYPERTNDFGGRAADFSE